MTPSLIRWWSAALPIATRSGSLRAFESCGSRSAFIPIYIANGGIFSVLITIVVMEAHIKDYKPPPKVIVRPAATDQAWRTLWDWLLSPPDNDVAARANIRQDLVSRQDQTRKNKKH